MFRFEHFSPFSRDFGGSVGIKNPCFLVVFLALFFPKNKERKDRVRREREREREPKTFRRFTPSLGNSSMWRAQETAENRRFSQKTEDFRSKPQEIADWAL